MRKLVGAAAATGEQRSEQARKAWQTLKAKPEALIERKRRERVTKAQKHIGASLVLTGVKVGPVTAIPAEELNTLKVDESYQRSEIKGHVSKLIAVLQAGGVVPDPITVAVRPDGSRYIVDGQQRYWAHWNCNRPIRAQIVEVSSVEAERTLFSVMNARVQLNASARVKTWPGPGAELVRQLDTDPVSKLQYRVLWGGGAGAHGTGAGGTSTTVRRRLMKLAASTLAQAVLICLTGAKPKTERPEELLPKLDHLVRENPQRATRAARGYAAVWSQLAEGGLQSLPRSHCFALALAFNEKWKLTYPPELTTADANRLRKMNWFQYAPDGKNQWIPLLKTEIVRRWRG